MLIAELSNVAVWHGSNTSIVNGLEEKLCATAEVAMTVKEVLLIKFVVSTLMAPVAALMVMPVTVELSEYV